MAGELITRDWQIEVGGLLLGAGTGYAIEDFQVRTRPSVRTSDVDRPLSDGVALAGPDLLSSRPVDLTVVAMGEVDTIANLTAAFEAAWALVSSGTTPLVWRRPGEGVRRIEGRPRRLDIDESQLLNGIVRIQARFEAPDPRIYSDNLYVQAFDASGPVGGAGWNAPWPMAWTETADPSEVQATNLGTATSPMTWVITGPCVNPRLELVESGQYLEFGMTLATGQVLSVDVRNRTADVDGVGAVGNKTLRSTWWELPPGTSTVRFRSFELTGTAVATWRDAY